MWFFWCFWPKKTGRAGQIIFKLSTKRNQVLKKKNLENENFIAAALHAQIGFRRSDQSQSSTLGQPTSGSPVLKFLIWNNSPPRNGSRGTHFAKFLISKTYSLTYSALGWDTILSSKWLAPILDFWRGSWLTSFWYTCPSNCSEPWDQLGCNTRDQDG